MRIYIFLLLLSIIIVSSCSKKKVELCTFTEIETINLNSYPYPKEKISNLFDSIQFIFLETEDSSLVGLDIERCEFFSNRIYILNRLTSRTNILCFDNEGKFLFKIDQVGNGPKEYTYLGDFFIDEALNQLVLIAEQGRILYFDLEGNYLHEKRKNQGFYVRQHIYINDSTYMGYNDVDLPPLGYSIIEYDSKNWLIRDSSALMKEPLGYLGLPTLNKQENSCFYYNLNDTIYDVTDIMFPTPIYFVNFGKNIINIKKDIFTLESRNHSLALDEYIYYFENQKMKIVGAFYINDFWIAMNILTKLPESSIITFQNTVALYNKKEKKSYLTSTIEFDILNISSIENIKVIGENDGYLYLLLSSNDFIEKNRSRIQKSNLLDKDIRELLNRNVEDNPILLKLK